MKLTIATSWMEARLTREVVYDEDLGDDWELKVEGKFLFRIRDDSRGQLRYFRETLTEGKQLHGKAEIRLLEKDWDFLRLMNFLSYMPPFFACAKVGTTRVSGYQRVMKITRGEYSVIKIYISEALDTVAVFLTGTNNWIEWLKEDIYCVSKIAWDLDKPESHPLRVFGLFFGRSDKSPCALVNAAFRGVFARTRELAGDLRCEKGLQLQTVLERLPGYVELEHQSLVAR